VERLILTNEAQSKSWVDGIQMKKMQKQLLLKDQEIQLLKETVRRECEERVELLSKLEGMYST
jgi:hypothetical protein